MNRWELDKELEEYIAERRRAGLVNTFLSGWKSRTQNSSELHPSIETYNDATEPVEQSPTVPKVEEYNESAVHIIERRSFLSRIFGNANGVKQDYVELALAKEDAAKSNELKEDLRHVAKVTLGLINNMNPREVDRFKRSQEFVLFKNLLKKNQIIK